MTYASIPEGEELTESLSAEGSEQRRWFAFSSRTQDSLLRTSFSRTAIVKDKCVRYYFPYSDLINPLLSSSVTKLGSVNSSGL